MDAPKPLSTFAEGSEFWSQQQRFAALTSLENLAFLEYVNDEPAALERSSFAELERRLPFLRDPQQAWPVFLSERRYEELALAVARLVRLAKELPYNSSGGNLERWTAEQLDSKITEDCARRGLTPDLLAELLHPDAVEHLISRQDLVLSSVGFKLVEFNIAGNIGGWESRFYSDMLASVPLIQRFLQSRHISLRVIDTTGEFFRHAWEASKAWLQKPPSKFTLAFTLNTEVPADGLEIVRALVGGLMKAALDESANGMDCQALICQSRELSVIDGRVEFDGIQIDCINELGFANYASSVVRACADRKVCLLNGPVSPLVGDKRGLALLSTMADDGRLPADDAELVHQYVPWTRRVLPGEVTVNGQVVDVESYAFENRDTLVLKSGTGYGGKQVLLGPQMEDAPWQTAVRDALRTGDWIIQEYVATPPVVLQHGETGAVPHTAIWGLFDYGGRPGGGFLRVAPTSWSGPVSTARGAQDQALWLTPQ